MSWTKIYIMYDRTLSHNLINVAALTYNDGSKNFA